MPNKPPRKQSKLYLTFERLASFVSKIVGSPFWFAFSIFIVAVWAFSSPLYESREIWHLQINTTTTILTFLMMALLHASQSKWEERMERLQQREKTEIKAIEKITKELAYNKDEKPVQNHEAKAEEKIQEHIDSLN